MVPRSSPRRPPLLHNNNNNSNSHNRPLFKTAPMRLSLALLATQHNTKNGPCSLHRGGRRLIRALPLLLLSICAATAYLRLITTEPPSIVDTVHNPTSKTSSSSDSRTITDSDSSSTLKTHLSSTPDRLRAQHAEKAPIYTTAAAVDAPSCRAMIDGTKNATTTAAGGGLLCCDRSHYRTDVCYMKGDVRTEPRTNSIYLHGASTSGTQTTTPEKIRPYTRKWETAIMATVDELTLVPLQPPSPPPSTTSRCDVTHRVPGIVMSTGGYTGNVYHEFNDGLLPLFVTAERFKREVVVLLLEYHPWWVAKYSAVMKRISRYELVDLRRDRRVHCFNEMIVGLKIHGELTIDPNQMPSGKGMPEFQQLLDEAFPSNRSRQSQEEADSARFRIQPAHLGRRQRDRPTIAIFVRHRSRVLLNLRALVRRCQKAGFGTVLVDPKRNTPMSHIHAAVSGSDAMLAVHGAAVTHFLFMRPATTLVQVVPLGLDWAAEEYYAAPARRMGLRYLEYKLAPEESTLLREFGRDHPVIAHPEAITSKGWQETKRVYLEHQNITINLKRFDKVIRELMSQVRERRNSGLGAL